MHSVCTPAAFHFSVTVKSISGGKVKDGTFHWPLIDGSVVVLRSVKLLTFLVIECQLSFCEEESRAPLPPERMMERRGQEKSGKKRKAGRR